MNLYPENVVKAVEGVCQGAVDIEPPVAGEVLLIEDRAVLAEQLEVGEGGVEGGLIHPRRCGTSCSQSAQTDIRINTNCYTTCRMKFRNVLGFKFPIWKVSFDF